MSSINKQVLTLVFSGLTPQEIHSVIGIANTCVLKSGEILLDIKDQPSSIFIVMKGSIGIERDAGFYTEKVEILGEGSWIGELGLSQRVARNTKALALEDTILLEIKESAFPALSPNIQIHFLKKMNDMAATRINGLMQSERRIESKTRGFWERKIHKHNELKDNCEGSVLIEGIMKKVPKLPVFTTGLANKLTDDKVALEEVSSIVKTDPALVGIVLKTINSAYFNLQKKITSIHQAILFLGFTRLYQLLLSEGLSKIMPKTPEFQEIHKKSVAISNIAYALALSSKKCDPVQASTIGLLKDVGQIVTGLLNQQNPKLKMLIDNMDAPIIGSILLKQWNLPRIIWQSIEVQTWPEHMPPEALAQEYGNQAIVLYLSEICYNHLKDRNRKQPNHVYLDEYCKHMGWDSNSIEEITRKQLLPGLLKNIESYPEFFRLTLKNYM